MNDFEAAEPIAVIGLACRVPGAGDADRFWHNVVTGVESRTELSPERLRAAGVSEADLADPNFVPVGFLLDDIESFDAALFGMTDREADLVDPQHRIFLELCHSALENAGCDPARYDGSIGVYGGRGMETYRWHHIYRNRALAAVSDHMTVGIGNHADNFTTLVSFRLNLRGPSVGVYTACSTSLVAVHLAAEALRAGECDIALAGGVSIELPMATGYVHHEGGAESADGHCRPFDAAATGTTWGSGGGVVALKRLEDALADGDPVRAVLRGNAINNDGSGKVGFTAPSVEGQMQVIAEALAAGGVDARSVSYVEAHGTGTSLGDPIEVEALSNVFGRDSADKQWCALGSVKANVGHLSHGAGVVGLIKTVLAMEHRVIPPLVNFRSPNPAIDFDASPFYVNTSVAAWQPDSGVRRAGVSSFGIGGTNAHVVVEEAPLSGASRVEGPHLLQVSARSAAALDVAVARLADHLGSATDLGAVAHTLRVGRVPHRHRAAVVASDPADAAVALRDKRRKVTGEAGRPRVVLLFPGQGAQYAGMGRALYAAEPVFASTVDTCADVLGWDPRELLFGDDHERLAQTAVTQPALFTIEYALAELWRSWGLKPDTMIGHSIGEYVAATVAGVFTLPDALRLVATRGRLMQSLPAGAMLAVNTGESALGELPDGLSVAAVNGPHATVVSGPSPLVDAYAQVLAERRVAAKRLRTSHAFHSAMMAPILDEFTAAVAAVPRRAPVRSFLSNRTGQPVTADQATDPAYWAAQLREPVRFADCVATALRDGPALFVECGPGRQLVGLARVQIPRDQPLPLVSLPSPNEPGGDVETLLAAVGRLWVSGVPLPGFGSPTRRVPLPGYPYERTYHWVKPDPVSTVDVVATGRRPADEWFWVPSWHRLPPVVAPTPPARVVVYTAGPVGAALADLLRSAGSQVTEVAPGGDAPLGGDPHVVHAWSLDTHTDDVWEHAERGFFAVLDTVQALAASGSSSTVDIVTAGACQVRGDEPTRPADALVTGVLRSAPFDLPDLALRHLDVDPADPRRDLAALVAELGSAGPEVVALRSGRRWGQDFAGVRLPAPPSDTGIRPGGGYLVTGGLGALGFAVAEDIVRQGGRVVLLGRTPSRDTGGRLSTVVADVTDAAGLRAARSRVLDILGTLHGIVHCAGVAGGGVTATRTRDDMRPVLAPKVLGPTALYEAFGDLELDFVTLYSSVVGTVGGLGEVDYCAANAYLDAYAQGPHGWRAPVRSVAWTGWLGPGMRGSAAPTDSTISPVEGLDALRRVTAYGPTGHVLVSPVPVDRLRALARVDAEQAVAEATPRPSVVATAGRIAPRTEWERRIAAIWTAVLGVAEPSVDADFFDLGGNSLVAVQLIAQVRKEMGVKLPMRSVFETPTIEGMAARVAELRAARAARAGMR